MNIVFVLLPLTVLLGGAFVLGYRWSVRSGQFDDLDTPAVRILADEEEYAGRETWSKK